MSQSRQLAAIMFTDIVGYTKLMGEDEQKAFELLKKNRSVQRPLIEKFNGRWLKEIGDGVLASFSTVSDAIYCAVTIQKTCENEPDLKLRIGIHQGEVVFEDNDVFGDGVNIASRLEALAPAGGILVSDTVHRNVINKKGIVSTFVSEEKLKGVKEPVKIYQVQELGAVGRPTLEVNTSGSQITRPVESSIKLIWVILALLVAGAGYVFYTTTFTSKSDSSEQGTSFSLESDSDVQSIAVLPFGNMSSDEENEFFINGMAEDIRNKLSKISQLRVTSKTSSERYRKTTMLSTEIGQELGVSYLLEGTAQKIGTKIKIHAQLINTKTDAHIWGQTYERDISDVTELFKVQNEIAEGVTNELQITLKLEEQQQLETVPTHNGEAYDLYLKAQQNRRNWGLDRELRYYFNAVELYQKAERLDTMFALPILDRANFYHVALKDSRLQDEIVLDSLLILSNRAIEIDSTLANAYLLRSYYYNTTGAPIKAMLDKEKVLELDPKNYEVRWSTGMEYFRSKNYIHGLQLVHDAAKIATERSEQQESGILSNYWILHRLGLMYMELYDTDEALLLWDKMIEIEPNHFVSMYSKVYLEKPKVAYSLIQNFIHLNPNDLGLLIPLAAFYVQTKDYEKGLEHFKKAAFPSDNRAENEFFFRSLAYKGVALYRTGKQEEGVRLLKEALVGYQGLESKPAGLFSDHEVSIAGIHAVLGNKREAYNWLYKSDWTNAALYDVQRDVWFSSMRGEKEFQSIVNEVMEEKKKIRDEIARLKVAGDWEIKDF